MLQAKNELPRAESRRDTARVHCTIGPTGIVQLIADRVGGRVLLDAQDRHVDVDGHVRTGHAFVPLCREAARELLAELTAAIAEADTPPSTALWSEATRRQAGFGYLAPSRHPNRRRVA